MVFDNASALSSGVASPNRTMFIGTNTAHIFVDLTNNRLYAAGGQNLFIIDNASSANGPVTAKQVIAPGGTSMQGIAVAP